MLIQTHVTRDSQCWKKAITYPTVQLFNSTVADPCVIFWFCVSKPPSPLQMKKEMTSGKHVPMSLERSPVLSEMYTTIQAMQTTSRSAGNRLDYVDIETIVRLQVSTVICENIVKSYYKYAAKPAVWIYYFSKLYCSQWSTASFKI